MKLALLAALVISSAYTDLVLSKVKNMIIAVFMAVGPVFSLASGGMEGLADSAAGAVIPLVLLFPLFALKMLGAGDVKLFCAEGALMGKSFILADLAFSFLAGGLMALAFMLGRKNTRERFVYFLEYIKNCCFTLSFPPYMNGGGKKDGSRFPFAVSAACGAFAAVLYLRLI